MDGEVVSSHLRDLRDRAVKGVRAAPERNQRDDMQVDQTGLIISFGPACSSCGCKRMPLRSAPHVLSTLSYLPPLFGRRSRAARRRFSAVRGPHIVHFMRAEPKR